MMADGDQSGKVDFNSHRRLTGAGTGALWGSGFLGPILDVGTAGLFSAAHAGEMRVLRCDAMRCGLR
jgi:hypothetical protein